MMNILIIDGMGGGMGKNIIEYIKRELKDIEITAVGTNSIATAAMLKAGADNGATGENAVMYNSLKADYIIGAIGIVFANSMYGEISPKMANAVSSSNAHKILLPVAKCNMTVLGLVERPINFYLSEIINVIRSHSDSYFLK